MLRARVLDQLGKRMMLAGDVVGGIEVARQAIEAAQDRRGGATPRDSVGDRRWLRPMCTTPWAPAWPRSGEEAAGLAEFEQAGALAYGNTKTALRFSINYSDALHLAGRYQRRRRAGPGRHRASPVSLGLQRSIGAMLAGNAAEPLIALGPMGAGAAAMINRALELDPPAHHTRTCGCCGPGCASGGVSSTRPTRS